MNQNNLIINPVFKRFLDIASVLFQLIALIISVMFTVFFISSLISENAMYLLVKLLVLVGVLLATLGYYIIFVKLCHISVVNTIKALLYYCVLVTIKVLVIMGLMHYLRLTALGKVILPTIIANYLPPFMTLFATTTFIVLALVFVISLALIVRDLFYSTLEISHLMGKISSEELRKRLMLLGFILLFTLSVGAVFTVAGDAFWLFSADLMRQLGGIEFVVNLGLAVYFVRLLIAGATLIEEPKKTFFEIGF